MKNTILYFFFVALLFISCDNNDNNGSYFFAETQCANPWQDGLFSGEEPEIVIKEYLEALAVDVEEVIIEPTGEIEACFACSCLSGNIIAVKANPNNEQVLFDLGFYQ